MVQGSLFNTRSIRCLLFWRGRYQYREIQTFVVEVFIWT